MTAAIAIYGADGFGREVMPLARVMGGVKRDAAFIDDDPLKQNTFVNGHPVISFQQALSDGRSFCPAIANGSVRKQLARRIHAAGGQTLSIRAPSAIIYDEVLIGEGAILCDNVIVTSNVHIGRHFHANIYSYIAHDCVIGDFVTFAPRVSCNGRVIIQDHAYIGTGAVLRQGRHDKPLIIGAGATVGMGAVVTKDVPPGTTVVGNPARPLEMKPSPC